MNSLSLQPAIRVDGATCGLCIEWQCVGSASAAADALRALPIDDTVVGLGTSMAQQLGLTVPDFVPFAGKRRGTLTMPATPHDLWTLMLGAGSSSVFEAAERLRAALYGVFRVAEETALFRYRDGNDLTGYRDGSANPSLDRVNDVAMMPSGPLEGGTFALLQRYLHFRTPLRALAQAEQDRILGRALDTDEELPDAPHTAHIRRADQEREGAGGYMIRRSMPWGGVERHGLQFIGYARNLAVFERTLDRMIGAADEHADALLSHTQAETGAYYFCPPQRDGRLMLGEPDATLSTTAQTEDVETVAGHGVRLRFFAKRCIHSRSCVLARPDVFVPNVVGEWLHPELASANEIAELAHRCPSGAIAYERTDGEPDERAPKVNTVRVRENGPLAFHAELEIDARAAGFRRTLCRCGRSQNKPFCDGSHVEGFSATGEPQVIDSSALASRDGVLSITPMRDGPLMVSGALEVVSGTGHTVNRATRLNLCRCGASNNKPYCDGSHARVGFRG